MCSCAFGSYVADATRNCCHLCAFCVHHTTMYRMRSLHVKPHTYGAYDCMFSCNQPLFCTFGRMTGFFLKCYCGRVTRDGLDTKIRVSTENWPWRRKYFPSAPAGTRTRDLSITCSIRLPIEWGQHWGETESLIKSDRSIKELKSHTTGKSKKYKVFLPAKARALQQNHAVHRLSFLWCCKINATRR